MIIWGVNALNHGSSVAVVNGNKPLQWLRNPNSDRLESKMVTDAINFSDYRGPEIIAWYERPWIKKTRQLYAGQWEAAMDMTVMPRRYLKHMNLRYPKVVYHPHHKSHAAAGFFTSPFNQAMVVVLDAIGEWESASIWLGSGTTLTKMWSASYPNSLGLFYSAFTKLIGFKPIAEEFCLQQLSDQGDPNRYYFKVKSYFDKPMMLNRNLHRGVWDWDEPVTDENRADIAAAVQQIFEEQVDWVMALAKSYTKIDNLVYMGGCAMNSKYNKKLNDQWSGVWSLPDPGDGSSAIGAALLTANKRINCDLGVVKHLKIQYNS